MDLDQLDQSCDREPAVSSGANVAHNASGIGRLQSGACSFDGPPNLVRRKASGSTTGHSPKTVSTTEQHRIDRANIF